MMSTGSFVSRAERLLNRLGQVQAQREDAKARAVVEAARTRANRSRQALNQVIRVTPGLVERGELTPPVLSATVRGDVVKARTALRTTASSIVGAEVGEIASRIGSQSVHHALEVGEKLVRSMTADLNKLVEKRRQALLPTGIDQPIVTYPGVSLLLVTKLQGAQRRLGMKVDSLNPDQLEQRLDEILRDAGIWAQDRPLLDRGLEDQHPDIKEFLRQATTEAGAPWSLVTPTVSDWLSNPENTSSLRIVLRS